MNDANNTPHKPAAKWAGIKIRHLLGLKKGRPMRICTECGELLVRLERVSPLGKRAIVSIEAVGQVKPTLILGGSGAMQAMADRLRGRLYKPCSN